MFCLRLSLRGKRGFRKSVRLSSTMSLRSYPVDRCFVSSDTHIRLTEDEDRVCQLLDDYVKNAQEDVSMRTVCRIAGGWVRDKLLGSECHDIDIALSNSMGFTFAEGLAAYAARNGVETGTISKIAQNPEQSKHLETATFKVFGLEVDIVNLRCEEYASDSRIPTGVSFGTPLQDALRRDITINALFYNVHSREVEDFTGKGRDDLESGIVRTPLPPRETFLDDPLRVLRCIRFASRLGFRTVPELEEAAKDPLIQKAIVNKVARERVGEELVKMMRGRDPTRSIELIYNLSLYPAIFFAIPEAFSSSLSGMPEPARIGWTTVLVLRYLFERREQKSGSKIPNLDSVYYEAVVNDPTCSSRLYLAAALTPYRRLTYRDTKSKEKQLVELVLRESLKLGTQFHFLDGIPPLFTACDLIASAVSDSSKLHPSSERVGIGLLLRERTIHNPVVGVHWTSSFLFSLVLELVECYDVENDALDEKNAIIIIEKYNSFARNVDNFDLRNAGEMKPLLDGRQVVTALGATKPGAWLGKVLGQVIEWQLEHPTSSKQECVAWLQEQRRIASIVVDDSISEPATKRTRTKR